MPVVVVVEISVKYAFEYSWYPNPWKVKVTEGGGIDQ